MSRPFGDRDFERDTSFLSLRVGKSHRVFRKRDHRRKNQDDGGRDDDDDDRGHRGL